MKDRPHPLLHAYTEIAAHRGPDCRRISRGAGVFVYDDHEQQYLEGIAGLWCAAFGFDEGELVDAAMAQLKRLPSYHVAAGAVAPVVERLAEKLTGAAGNHFSHVFFTNSGSEANDTQVKLLWLYNNVVGRPDKKKVISRRRAYHGATLATASLTGLSVNHSAFDLPLPFVRHVEPANYPAGAEVDESEDQYAARLAAELDAVIESEGPDTVAAFIAEPVMAAGGVLIPPARYFEEVQVVLRRHDVRLIVDEVICGFGRLGYMWGHEAVHAEPDSLSCAKALTAGYMPMGAVVIDEKLAQAIASESGRAGVFAHGFTFGGHPVAAAVALRVLELLEERAVVRHVQRIAPSFQTRLAELGEHGLVAETRGLGLLGGVQLRSGGPKASQVVEAARRHALIVRALGDDVIALCPPLVISDAEVESLFARLRRALDELR